MKARRTYRGLCIRKCGFTTVGDLPRYRREAVPAHVPFFHRPNDAVQKHIELSRRAELPGQPFQLALDCPGLRIPQQSSKEGHCRPQAAHAYPHLMDAFRIAFSESSLVADDLPETGPANDLEGFACAQTRRENDRRTFDRRPAVVVEQFVAAFRLALDSELGRKALSELTGNREQISGASALQLDLYLTQRGCVLAGVDCALIDCQSSGACAIGNLVLGSLYPRLKQWFQPLTHFLCENSLERGPLGQSEVRLLACDLRFPFVTIECPRIGG